MIELRTCPFCGGRPYVEEDQRGFINGQSTHVCFIRCCACNSRSPRIDIDEYKKQMTAREAIDMIAETWNTRVDDAPFMSIKLSSDRKNDKKRKLKNKSC